jgi:hypothetical protein
VVSGVSNGEVVRFEFSSLPLQLFRMGSQVPQERNQYLHQKFASGEILQSRIRRTLDVRLSQGRTSLSH